MSIYVRTLSFAFFTFPTPLKQLQLAFKQSPSLSISNSRFLQNHLQQVLYITAKGITIVFQTTNQELSRGNPMNLRSDIIG